MIKKLLIALGISSLALSSISPAVFAQSETPPISMPADNRLVTFVFDANDSYAILTRPRSITDLVLRQGETVVALALGDTAQWITELVDGHIFIKPIRENIFTSGTLVTNQRSYQLTFRSSPENGKFYQRVSWEYPTIVRHRIDTPEAQPIAAMVAERADKDAVANVPLVDISKIKFGYSIKGEAPFKPINVFDDGVFTYLRLPANLQDMPAVFIKGASEVLELTNYLTKGEHIVVQRLTDKVVLKLGKAEVEITSPDANRPAPPKSILTRLFEGS